MGACRALMGSAKIQPTLNEKLQEVYEVINEFNKKSGKPERLDRMSLMTPSPDILNKKAVFDFQAASYSVPESIGILNLVITRSGMKDNEVTLKVISIDGTAKAGMDFEKVDIKVVFEPFVMERTIGVKIIDDNQWEPDESFFLRLALADPKREDAMLGPTHTMEITIIDDDCKINLGFMSNL
jgi:solute carrier family 8 (sodium/calcium exchanger)